MRRFFPLENLAAPRHPNWRARKVAESKTGRPIYAKAHPEGEASCGTVYWMR